MSKVYKIRGYDMNIYCKVSSFTKYSGEIAYTLSFGGKNEFCLISKINSNSPKFCYIDRVEKNSSCVIDGTLEEKGGTEILVKLAIWTIHTLFPDVTIFTFNDNSHIYCQEGSKLYKLSLSYDYILKHNQTWYQNKFGAKLPHIVRHEGEKPIDELFTESLQILDHPLEPFDNIKITCKSFIENQNIYNSSSSPRDFINNLRIKYGKEYCFKVGEWLTSYMMYLGINLYDEFWFIDTESIIKPPKYNIQEIGNIIKGGNKTQKRRRIVKIKNFGLCSYKHSRY